MIKRFIRRVLGLATESMVRVPRGKHGLSRDSILSGVRAYLLERRDRTRSFPQLLIAGACWPWSLPKMTLELWDLSIEPDRLLGRTWKGDRVLVAPDLSTWELRHGVA